MKKMPLIIFLFCSFLCVTPVYAEEEAPSKNTISGEISAI